MTGQLLFVGDASWDVTMFADHMPAADEKLFASSAGEVAGGVAANAAVAAHKCGARVRALLAIGCDSRGDLLVADLERAGIDSVGPRKGRSTLCVSLVDPSGEKRLLLYPGAPMYPGIDAVRNLSILGIDWVHTAIYDRESGAELIRECRRAGARWSLDLEPATFPGGIEDLGREIQGAAAVFCNDAAASAIGARAARVLLGMGAEVVVRTRGPRGAGLYTAEGPRSGLEVAAPTLPSPVIDTAGAGDCLAGWFIASLVEGLDADRALRRAVTAATLSCAAAGGHLSYPSRGAVDRCLERTSCASKV